MLSSWQAGFVFILCFVEVTASDAWGVGGSSALYEARPRGGSPTSCIASAVWESSLCRRQRLNGACDLGGIWSGLGMASTVERLHALLLWPEAAGRAWPFPSSVAAFPRDRDAGLVSRR